MKNKLCGQTVAEKSLSSQPLICTSRIMYRQLETTGLLIETRMLHVTRPKWQHHANPGAQPHTFSNKIPPKDSAIQ